MNGASKILTVSYGTFSCTLEGFDDPFNTMKAIAEYFRDLAADDRYFGAEPPTPDAAMLHRIAEREIQRRVEAKVGEHGIVLRAGDAVATPVAAPTPAPSPVAASMPAPQAEAPLPAPTPAMAMPLAEPVAQPAVASAQDAAPAVESAAARLHRLRAAQSQIQSQTPAQPVSVVAPAVVLPATSAPVEIYAEDQEAAPEAPMPAEMMAAPSVVQEAAPEDDTEEAVESVLAALQAAPETRPVAMPEIEAEDDLPVLSSLRETLAGLMPQDDQLAEDMAQGASDVELIDTTEADETAWDDAEEALIENAPDIAAVEETMAEIEEDPLPVEVAEAEEPVEASVEQVTAAQEEPSDEMPVEAASTALARIDVAHGAPVVTEKLQRARARVIKIRRLDKREVTPSALSAEDEADLQNTLAALEAEVGPLPGEVTDEAPAAAKIDEAIEVVAAQGPENNEAPAMEAPAPGPRPGATDASVERILAQTNEQLEVPEIKRRRSAIAHLKAAVLATVADRLNSPKARAAESEAKADPYRQDLGKVVRPMAASPSGERPAPLVLVSAQRIDRKPDAAADANRPMPQIVSSSPAPAAASLSVRPRRVTGGGMAQAVAEEMVSEEDDLDDALQVGEAKQSFAEFAESLGAASLSDLLEAAGAYCTLVLDRPSFSRPLLFSQVSQLPTMAETKREDSLRNFGKLLREGRFKKTERGQFSLTEISPILTEAKKRAG